ncbi:MAG: hypothetical protein OEZ34_10505, partial [Spirochaetia bacterium]|nr:hypothetical protein [Spirochaetia bacterium]
MIFWILQISMFQFSLSAEPNSITKNNRNIQKQSHVLIVVYSYTGNTALLADELKKRFNGDLIVLKTDKYSGLTGNFFASMDS